jgi:hypothetical protein
MAAAASSGSALRGPLPQGTTMFSTSTLLLAPGLSVVHGPALLGSVSIFDNVTWTLPSMVGGLVTRRPCNTKIGWSLLSLSGHGDKTVHHFPHPATAQRRKEHARLWAFTRTTAAAASSVDEIATASICSHSSCSVD